VRCVVTAVVVMGVAGVAHAEGYDLAGVEKRKPAQVTAAPNLDDPYSDPFLAAGRDIYMQRCAPCHGMRGRADGAAAAYVDPPPRNLELGVYKFRSTETGELPTDADLFRIISIGLSGTAMPAWGSGKFELSEQQIWQVITFIKLLCADFRDEEFDPYGADDDGKPRILAMPAAPEITAERIEKGREIYFDEKRGACVRCHGKLGRGDGTDEKGFKDDTGFRVLPADMTQTWRYKNGATLEEIYATFTTGLNGTPMPSYVTSLPDEQDRWNMAMFVHSLLEEPAPSADPLVARRIGGDIPDDPAADDWAAAAPMSVWLAGQIVARPRWQNPAVDLVEVRALYNDDEIAFLFRWNDRFENRQAPDKDPEGELWQPEDSFVPFKTMQARAVAVPLPDQLAIHFTPGEPVPGRIEKPYLLMGDGRHPTNAWLWRADGGVTETRTAGTAKGYKPQPDAGQATVAVAAFADGQWTLILRRSLHTDDARGDVQFSSAGLIPFTLRVWDGSTGEWGLQSSMSAWHYVRLESETPMSAYFYALIAALIALALELLAVRALRRAPLTPAEREA